MTGKTDKEQDIIIESAQYSRDGVVVAVSGSKFFIETKRPFLEYGATNMLPLDAGSDAALPWWRLPVTVPGYPQVAIERGTTDPVILCVAQRAWTAHNSDRMNFGPFPVPEIVEARAELKAGRDVYGGEWPEPGMAAVSLNDTIESAKQKREAKW